MNPIDEEDVDTGETTDLDQAFLDEDPSILTDKELEEIGEFFGLTPEENKKNTQDMIRTRRNFAKQQDNYKV
jgi:hypothetical protein